MSAAQANTVGQPASFAFTVGQLMGPPMVQDVTGSMAGSAPAASMKGDPNPGDTSAGRVAVLANYGHQAAASAPHHQAVFWLVVLLVISVVMLSHVAHLSLK